MYEDFITEAEALSDYLECFENDNIYEDNSWLEVDSTGEKINLNKSDKIEYYHALNKKRYRVAHTNNIKVYNNYLTNKSAKVGEEIICPICGKHFVKKSYQQAFCCGHCKDTYHNRRMHYN